MSSRRSLADSIRVLDESALTRLFELRPDLTAPPPLDLTDVTERASSRPSTQRALDSLDAWSLRVANLLAALPDGVRPTQLTTVLGASGETVQAGLDELSVRALAWTDDETPDAPVHLTHAARAAFGQYPAGLAPASVSPLDDTQIREALQAVGEPGRKVLERLVWGPPTGSVRNADRAVSRDAAEGPIEALLAWGLLKPTGSDAVILPREVSLLLRQGHFFADTVAPGVPDWQPHPLPHTGAGLPVALVDRAAIGSAQEFVSHVEALVDAVANRSPKPLANGGMPKRELTVLGHLVGNEALARFVLDVARQARLLVAHDVWLATTGYDQWLDQDAWRRWHQLTDAWQAPAPRGVSADADTEQALTAALRRATWAELATAQPGQDVTATALAGRLAWRHPGWARLDLGSRTDQLTREAGWLGLLAFGRRTQLVVADQDPGFAPLGSELLVQSDLTAVATGPLDRATAQTMTLLADQESHGGAAVFRLGATSIRRGLDAGWTADVVKGWLRTHAPLGVPDSVLRLIDDVAAQHGQLQVVATSSVVLVDDPSTMEVILRHPQASEFALRRLGPGVLGSAAEPAELVEFLRAQGLAPVAQDQHGLRYTTPPARRAPLPPPPPRHPLPDPRTTARGLIAKAAAAEDSHQLTQLLPQLVAASRTDDWWMLDYVNPDGVPEQAQVRVLSVGAGVATLVKRAAGRFSVPTRRILAIRPAD